MTTAADCGHRCGCPELCPFGETKAEAARDERESAPDPYGRQADRAQARWERDRGTGTVGAAFLIALPVVTLMVAAAGHWLVAGLLVWLMLAVAVCLVVGRWLRDVAERDVAERDFEEHTDDALSIVRDDGLPLTSADIDAVRALPVADAVSVLGGRVPVSEVEVWLQRGAR